MDTEDSTYSRFYEAIIPFLKYHRNETMNTTAILHKFKVQLFETIPSSITDKISVDQ